MKLYVEDEEGDAVWVKATLPRPPEQYEPGLVVDAVVRGRPMSVKLPPEEMYQQEGLDMENCDDLCDLGHVHEASILDTIQERPGPQHLGYDLLCSAAVPRDVREMDEHDLHGFGLSRPTFATHEDGLVVSSGCSASGRARHRIAMRSSTFFIRVGWCAM